MKIKDSKFITGGKLNETYYNTIQNGNITQELIDDIIKRHKNTSALEVFHTYHDDVYVRDFLDCIRKLLKFEQESFSSNTALKLIINDCRLLLVHYVYNKEDEENVENIYKLTKGIFSLNDMFKLRFIRQYNREAYNDINDESDIKEIVKKIDDDENAKSANGNKGAFDNFKKNNGNYLRGIITPITDKALSDNKKAFSYLDICFFNFILDTYESTNAKNFMENLKNINRRNNNFQKNVDTYYLEIFRFGIETLSQYYYNDSDFEKFELQDKLNKIVEWSKPNVPLLLDTVKALEAEIETIMEEKILVPDEVLSKSIKKIDKVKRSLSGSKSIQNN